MKWLAVFVPAVVLAAVWVQSTLVLRGRQRALAELAARWQFMPLGDGLPLGMSLSETGLRRWTKLRNSYMGLVNGHEVAFFDCTVDWGRARWARTVIGSHDDAPLGLAARMSPDAVTESAGEWRILFRPRQIFCFTPPLLRIEQIDSPLRSLAEPGVRGELS